MRLTTRPGGDEGKCRNTPQGVSYRGGARCLTMAAKQVLLPSGFRRLGSYDVR